MKTTITGKLQEIEQRHRIRILYACESGSRAWGFPSPDSDYDVRFIYVRPLDSYLSIKETDDYLNFPLTDELDINGWDIRKTMKLISRSNTTPFEWIQSPVVYYEQEGFKDEVWNLCQNYFCRRSNIHHYLGIARGAMASIKDEELKIKKLFYILRPLLAAMWCIEKNSIAPMNISPLLELIK
ncbi:nucleotidyltransferase domain-containing protein [Dysgonomonas sp. 521]|uniref:nucleotidyltransferase domain-containing protein n=1 Tax=Dysgonomonas sp. 521 TaxID=2302932 RepID=UPI0013D840E9|nr:nucleotidyltransferase domain-containing protein [Dysgonomonas sp. 521]NDV93887.1 nucleotidyltransferase domain-containing protein [Dysgonomonas sp. 521]